MDLICSYVVLTLAAGIPATHALCGVRRGTFALRDGTRQTGDHLVDWGSPVLVRTLSPVVDALIAAGASANAVTGASLVAGLSPALQAKKPLVYRDLQLAALAHCPRIAHPLPKARHRDAARDG